MTNRANAPSPQSTSFRFTGFDLGLYATIIFAWSTSWYPLSLQVGVVAPEVSLTWRFACASLLMFLFLIITKRPIRFSLANHARFALLGILIFSTNFLVFYYAALQGLASGLLSVIFSTASITSLILSSILFRQRPDKRVALGGVIGLCGIALVFWPEISGTTFNHNALIGFLLGFCGVLCFSLGGIWSAKNQAAGLPLVSMNAWGMFYGTLWVALISVVRGQPFIIETTVIYLGSLVWLILLSTLLAFAVYLTLLGRIGAARAGYATVIFPILALLISTVTEGYQWTVLSLIGLIFVLVGNYFVLSRSKASKQHPPTNLP